MAKKIKYYGVFAVKTLGESDSKLAKLMTDTLGLPKLQKKQFATFVFDNELEQVDSMSDVICMNKGAEAIAIEATSREDFLEQVKKLKAKYEEEEAETVEEALFDVVLREVNNQEKLLTVKLVKETLGIGLKEAKDLVYDAPSKLAEKVNLNEADHIARTISSNCHCAIEIREADEDEQEEPTNTCAPNHSN